MDSCIMQKVSFCHGICLRSTRFPRFCRNEAEKITIRAEGGGWFEKKRGMWHKLEAKRIEVVLGYHCCLVWRVIVKEERPERMNCCGKFSTMISLRHFQALLTEPLGSILGLCRLALRPALTLFYCLESKDPSNFLLQFTSSHFSEDGLWCPVINTVCLRQIILVLGFINKELIINHIA